MSKNTTFQFALKYTFLKYVISLINTVFNSMLKFTFFIRVDVKFLLKRSYFRVLMFGMEGSAGFLAECIGLKIERRYCFPRVMSAPVMSLMAGWQSKGMLT